MKRFLKFLKWAGITLGTLIVLFIGINAFDETLDPGAASILNAQPKVKAEENAYFYLAGMYTAAANNPSEVGRKCVAAELKIAKTGTLLSDFDSVAECRGHDSLKSLEDVSLACDWRQQSCLKQFFAQRAAIAHLAAQNKVVLERYGKLLEFKQFEDNHDLHPLAVFMKFPPAKLYQAISVSRLQAGDASGFLNRTVAEAEFYRMVLRGESSLLYKMIGMAWLERSARLVSDAVQADPMLAQQNQAVLLQITRPYSVPERDLGKAMEGEFRFVTAMLRTVSTYNISFLERWFYWPLVKQNASSNYFYSNISVWRDLTQLPTEEYLAAEQFALGKLFNPWGDGYLHWVYNPIGKILVGLATPAHANYPRRIIDADGLLRLVSLQIQIAAQKIPESEISPFLKNAAPQFRDPYTGQPMQWDKTRGLYFRGHSDRITDKDGFVALKL